MKIVKQVLRILFFRADAEELSNFGYGHLVIGLFFTWIVGMGRYWDDPRAYPLQHLGMASVFYVFVLAFLLWLVILPLKPARWSYRQVLTYVTLTSPPALIYAIPVEHFLSVERATDANFFFLIIVAIWRVLLMSRYLRLIARLPFLVGFTGMLFPVTTVVSLLLFFDQHRAVFEIMAGFRHHLNPQDRADVFLSLFVVLSSLICPVAAIIYVVMIVVIHRDWLLDYVNKNKVMSSILAACLASGTSYGAVQLFYKLPLEALSEKVDTLDNPERQLERDNAAIAKNPKNAGAFANRAFLEQKKGQYVAALTDYTKAISMNRNEREFLVARAYLLNELGRPAEALDDLRAARRIATTEAILGGLTQTFNLQIFGLHQRQDANFANLSPILDDFCDASWLNDPQGSIEEADSRSLIKEVPILWQMRRMDEALGDCNHLIERAKLTRGPAPASTQHDLFAEDYALAEAYRMRGYTYQLLHQTDKALSDYNQALATIKNDQQTLFLKARLLKELGQDSEAHETFSLCRSAIADFDERESSRYIELLTLAALGDKKEAVARLTPNPTNYDPPVTSGQKVHGGLAWSNFLDNDYSEPARLWETGKILELLDMKPQADEKFHAAIAWMDIHKPAPENQLNFLLWRTKILLSLGAKDEANKAFQQVKSLGYAGPMPKTDLSAIDARLLVTHLSTGSRF